MHDRSRRIPTRTGRVGSTAAGRRSVRLAPVRSAITRLPVPPRGRRSAHLVGPGAHRDRGRSGRAASAGCDLPAAHGSGGKPGGRGVPGAVARSHPQRSRPAVDAVRRRAGELVPANGGALVPHARDHEGAAGRCAAPTHRRPRHDARPCLVHGSGGRRRRPADGPSRDGHVVQRPVPVRPLGAADSARAVGAGGRTHRAGDLLQCGPHHHCAADLRRGG